MKYILIVILTALISTSVHSQGNETDTLSLADKILNLTTLINTEDAQGVTSQGSGFFYYHEKYIKNDTIRSVWVVSNKHVLTPNDKIPKKVTIHFRKKINGQFIWHPITINFADLTNRIKFNPNSVDIAAIDVTEYYLNLVKQESPNIVRLSTVNKYNFNYYKNDKPDVSEDVLIIGYPKNFYDTFNTFPIVKNGIISTWFGKNFNNSPIFLIDSKLFPGSSGSIVIRKPKPQLQLTNDAIYVQSLKEIELLGIYSGEFTNDQKISSENITIQFKDSYNLGIVWYANLIESLLN